MFKTKEWLDRLLYAEFADNWDDEIFRTILSGRIDANSYCLDYGAGRGNVRQMNFKGLAKFVAGVDPGVEVFENPGLDEAKQLDLHSGTIPYEDESFDLVFSDNVMEHIQAPADVFKEIRRVLKPGGRLLAKTPNKWHYMPTIARATPTWFHSFYNGLRGRSEADTFPTVYKCNTKHAVEKYAQEAQLEIKQIRFIEGRPEYLRLTPFTYLAGFSYERLVNSSDRFAQLRCVMIFELEKPAR